MNAFKTLTVVTGLILVLSLTFTSCKKGDTGPAGTNGTNGTNGKDGKDGVANIQTGTVTTNNATWVLDNSDNSYNAVLTYTAITQSVIDRGTIQAFIGDGSSKVWIALPFSYGTVQYNYFYEVGKVTISITLSNGTVPTNPGGQQFKIVVIPPASKSPNSGSVDNEAKEAVFTIN
jgi:hypothetical protein